MREIEFRGKGLDDGKWHFGSLQVFKGYSIFDNIWNNFVPVHSKTVGQYTGLRDKNSRRIFEGDILICTHCGEIRSVVFDEEMAEFEFDKRDPVENPDGSCLCVDHREFEVIGNIHDNLTLKEKKYESFVCIS